MVPYSSPPDWMWYCRYPDSHFVIESKENIRRRLGPTPDSDVQLMRELAWEWLKARNLKEMIMSDSTGPSATEDWEIIIRFRAPKKIAKRIKKRVFEAMPQPMIPDPNPDWFSMCKITDVKKI